jgi:O-methyltransferase
MNDNALLKPAVRDYLLKVSLRGNAIAEELYRHTLSHVDQPHMISAPEQAQFLAMMIRLLQAKTIIEVGVYTGYASLVMAQALPENGRLIACDQNQEWMQQGLPFWKRAGVDQKIEVRLGDARDTLQWLYEEQGENSVDMVFIDADKIHYDCFYEWALKLVRPQGLIVLDNTLWVGEYVMDTNSPTTKSIDRLSRKVQHDSRVMSSLVPIGKGMLLAYKS